MRIQEARDDESTDPVPTILVQERDATSIDVRRAPLALAGGTLLLVGLLLGLSVTAVGASRTGELALDARIAGHRTGLLTGIAGIIDVALAPGVALLVLIGVCGLVWLRNRFAAVAVATLTIVGWVSVEVGKAVVHRPRPPAATVHALVTETAADSYPSGHTAFAAAVVFATAATMLLAGRRATWVCALGIPLVLVVGASRLYLGVHYLADVSGSLIFAAGSVLVAVALGGRTLVRLRRTEGRHR
ncbi:hypothetical protein GCM10027053_23250 [Intrasporangium mesophilum]